MGLNKLQVEFLRTKWWTYGFRASACSRTLPSRRRCGRSEWRMRSTRTPLTWVPFLRTACMSTKFSTGIYWTLLHKLINFILIYFFLFFQWNYHFEQFYWYFGTGRSWKWARMEQSRQRPPRQVWTDWERLEKSTLKSTIRSCFSYGITTAGSCCSLAAWQHRNHGSYRDANHYILII